MLTVPAPPLLVSLLDLGVGRQMHGTKLKFRRFGRLMRIETEYFPRLLRSPRHRRDGRFVHYLGRAKNKTVMLRIVVPVDDIRSGVAVLRWLAQIIKVHDRAGEVMSQGWTPIIVV